MASFVDELPLNRACYYIKRSSIVGKIEFDGRVFYPKFERIDEPLTPTVISQHLSREYTIAAPLFDADGLTRLLLLEYKGEEPQRFYFLMRHLLESLGIANYRFFHGKSSDKILAAIIPETPLDLTDADRTIRDISDKLATRLGRSWKHLPDATLPDDYQIVTLPYAPFEA